MKRTMMIVALAASVSAAQTSRVLSLGEAVELGLRNSRPVKMSSARASAERARSDEADAQRLPALVAAGGYTRIEDGAFRLSTKNLPQPFTVGDVVADNYMLRLGLRQPLFTGFRLYEAARSADARAAASDLDVLRARENVEFAVVGAYWWLYQSRQNLRSAAENVKRLESYREDARRLVATGLMTTRDQLKVEVQSSSSQIAWLEARDAARLAEIDLNLLLGLPEETVIELTSRPAGAVPGDSVAGEAEPMDLVEAAARRSDVEAASLRVASAQSGVRAAQGGWWPQIELTANYQYSSPNSRYQPITPEFLGTWDVGLTFAFEVWNWGLTSSRVEQAEAALRQAELAEQDVRAALSREVQEAAMAVRRAREKISLAGLGLSQARENLRTESDRFRSGLASPTELLDAEVSLVSAETQASGAEVQYALARAALARALGTQRPGETARP